MSKFYGLALVARARTGRGSFIDVSLAETVLGWQSIPLTIAARAEDGLKRRAAALNGGAACYQIYRTADGRHFTLGAVEAKFWASFCRAVGRPDWAARQSEPLPQTGLIAEVAALIATEPLAHWEKVIEPADCCFHPVIDLRDVADHPQIAARGLVHRAAADPALIEVLFPAWVDGAPPAPRAPLRFAAAEAVLRGWRA